MTAVPPIDAAARLSVPLHEWLQQFDTDADRDLARRLAGDLRFFSLDDVRGGLRALHHWLSAQPGFDLRATRFTSFAEGKSGGLIQYFYRTSNFLHYRHGIDWSALGSPPADPKLADPQILVIMDDFIGSGREAAWYFGEARPLLDRYRHKYFVSLVGFAEGIDLIGQQHPDVVVHSLEVHQKIFESDRYTADEKAALEAFLRRYGDRVYPPERYGAIASPFGYRDGQALVAFFYNTPSNTLPIFWSVENGWKPLHQRFDSYNVPLGPFA